MNVKFSDDKTRAEFFHREWIVLERFRNNSVLLLEADPEGYATFNSMEDGGGNNYFVSDLAEEILDTQNTFVLFGFKTSQCLPQTKARGQILSIPSMKELEKYKDIVEGKINKCWTRTAAGEPNYVYAYNSKEESRFEATHIASSLPYHLTVLLPIEND